MHEFNHTLRRIGMELLAHQDLPLVSQIAKGTWCKETQGTRLLNHIDLHIYHTTLHYEYYNDAIDLMAHSACGFWRDDVRIPMQMGMRMQRFEDSAEVSLLHRIRRQALEGIFRSAGTKMILRSAEVEKQAKGERMAILWIGLVPFGGLCWRVKAAPACAPCLKIESQCSAPNSNGSQGGKRICAPAHQLCCKRKLSHIVNIEFFVAQGVHDQQIVFSISQNRAG